MYEYLVEYKQIYPTITTAELDMVATAKLVELAQETENDIMQPYGYKDDLVEAYNNLNTQELVLAAAYPTEASAIYYASKIANSESRSRYWAGNYLGNGDAFRHTAWNALSVRTLYNIGIGDLDTCISKTKAWTDAHEYGATEEATLSASQRNVDTNMDLSNNSTGRTIGRLYSTEAQILERTQYYVDNGYCKRIKTDAQIEYELDEMAAIPNWSLRATNTVGKN